jgi:hypothetical protein
VAKDHESHVMGGPGSGRKPRAVERALAVAGLSRVLLEPWRARCLRVGDVATADAIAVELAGRTWQNVNPYAAWAPEGLIHP